MALDQLKSPVVYLSKRPSAQIASVSYPDRLPALRVLVTKAGSWLPSSNSLLYAGLGNSSAC